MEAGHPLPQSETTQLSRPPQRALHSSHPHSRGRKELFTNFPGGLKLLSSQELPLDFDPHIQNTVYSTYSEQSLLLDSWMWPPGLGEL